VLEHAEKVLEAAERLQEEVTAKGRLARGRVRAAAATQAFVHLFAPFFESFMRAWPGIELTFRTTTHTEQTLADIRNGSTDVGFASLPVYSPALQILELFTDELVLVMNPSHALAGASSVRVEQLERERLILFERGASIRRATDQFLSCAGIGPELALESNDTYFIKRMVESGMGVSLLPKWAAHTEVQEGKLLARSIEGHRLRRSVAMVSLRHPQPAAVRTFVSFIIEHKAELQEAADGTGDLRLRIDD
jgi:LysR family transcriptional activator of glutamate synthase operon